MGYKESTPWEKKNGQGYLGYYRLAPKQEPDKPARTAEWTVDLPQVGKKYSVLATWPALPTNARNVAYDLYDGERPIGRVVVNQQQPPRGTTIKETRFQKLGTFLFTSRIIRIVLTSVPEGTVVSDSILVNPE